MSGLVIGVLLGAIHFHPGTDGPPRATLGLYAETPSGWVGAVYENCEGRASILVARSFGPVQLGLVSGYRALPTPLYIGLSFKAGGARIILNPKSLAVGWDF
jgi:hypothetical protein